MNVPRASDAHRRDITLLLAQPPDPTPTLVAHIIEGDRFYVEAPELPDLPAWQTRDLDIWRYCPPWIGIDEQRWGPLSPAEADQQKSVAIGMIGKLIDRLRQNLDVYNPLRSQFHDYWAPMIIGLSGAKPRSGLPLTDIDRVILTMMVVFDLSMLVAPPDLSPDSPPPHASVNRDLEFTKKLVNKAPGIRGSLRRCLEAIGRNPDHWLEMVLFGLLLHPQGMVWVRDPLNIGPSHGGTPLERGIEWAIGVPDTTYRSANKVHKAYQRAWGGAREPDRPGPKPGQPRRTSLRRQRFEAYVIERIDSGSSAKSLTNDSQAQDLYGKVRDDHAVVLSEQTIRRVLRKHRGSK